MTGAELKRAYERHLRDEGHSRKASIAQASTTAPWRMRAALGLEPHALDHLRAALRGCILGHVGDQRSRHRKTRATRSGSGQ